MALLAQAGADGLGDGVLEERGSIIQQGRERLVSSWHRHSARANADPASHRQGTPSGKSFKSLLG